MKKYLVLAVALAMCACAYAEPVLLDKNAGGEMVASALPEGVYVRCFRTAAFTVAVDALETTPATNGIAARIMVRDGKNRLAWVYVPSGATLPRFLRGDRVMVAACYLGGNEWQNKKLVYLKVLGPGETSDEFLTTHTDLLAASHVAHSQ